MKRNFNTWLSTFRSSIATYGFYVDFQKVYSNVDAIKVELNILNSLIGSKNIGADFLSLVEKYPEILKAIPVLLAKRESEIYCQDENGAKVYNFTQKSSNTPEEYAYFMKETGLFDLIANHVINSLVDYVLGVEVGMDTNGRKGRIGDAMEDLVESYLIKAGLVKGVTYFKEMTISAIEEKWGLDLSSISNQGKAEKRFDFVINVGNKILAIETNFYSSNGSKLNETARSYKTIALESKDIAGFSFVWITDGFGWKAARHNLEETFDVLDHIFCISDLENGVLETLLTD